MGVRVWRMLGRPTLRACAVKYGSRDNNEGADSKAYEIL